MATPNVSQQAEAVLRALSALYTNSTQRQKEEANLFLERFQKSVAPFPAVAQNQANATQGPAWTVVLELLTSTAEIGDPVRLFAAQTLRSKARLSHENN
jgi:hypothetical protein